MTLDDDKKIWNGIYKKDILPWHGIPLHEDIFHTIGEPIRDCLSSDSQNYRVEKASSDLENTVLVSGCGSGETAFALFKLGYCVIGTDISDDAIRRAKQTYGDRRGQLEYYQCMTQDLVIMGFKSKSAVDWLNMHHIEPDIIRQYLSSLSRIAEKLSLTYIFEPDIGVMDSEFTGKNVWLHYPKKVCTMVSMDKISEHYFAINEHPLYGKRWNCVNMGFRK
ncbi:class I SAM-dependent methyltransferase [Candidatus Woesearchaeota archaeon]|nr:class I SAM-dependent methyltransferase [Candidatus Woesearchaeota archaeon]